MSPARIALPVQQLSGGTWIFAEKPRHWFFQSGKAAAAESNLLSSSFWECLLH